DSGGFQIFSLQGLRRVSDEGVEFQSHLDGSRQLYTPETVIDIEHRLGADIIMAFDECVPYPSPRETVQEALERTHRWAQRCLEAHQRWESKAAGGWLQALYGITQGGVEVDLRSSCARTLRELPFDGYAIGGLAVGESVEQRNNMVEVSTAILPEDKPRYLMGVGTPVDILEAVKRGVDLFDCVLPTRNGRNGQVFTRTGTINLRNARYASDYRPIEEDCDCQTCQNQSRSFLRHLCQSNEMLGPILSTIHNLQFYQRLMDGIRSAIAEGRFAAFYEDFTAQYGTSIEGEQ
ncbi:MAG: tRNA guanosine(34) transglycosylase Tgt, partial [Armatimonadetes bacterium]|nr:tRNA guanosine(34) transglycosylase Tgt [Armatimonadota bacterium]